ncbi:MAG: DUF4175 family protein [Phycisphaerae bacterium]|nr:DUF4175 family protein [Phycisphaerae bacterium]
MIRRRLLVYGACAVASGGIVSLLTIVTVDFLFTLPPLLRLLGGILFLAGFVLATMRWIVKPIAAPMELPRIAALLESRFSVLNDRLSSSVDFMDRTAGRPEGLMHQVVEDTDASLRSMPLESVLNPRPLLRQAALLLVTVIAISGVLTFAPTWLGTGVYRYIYPFGAIEWPRAVALRPLTGNRAVAVGDAAVLRVAVDRGLTDQLRAVVYLLDASGQIVAQAMQREHDNVFTSRVDAITRDLVYWFEAGDADTRRQASTIRVVQRPEIVDVLASVEPPPYAPASTMRFHDLRQGPVTAPIGGFVTVSVTAAKPIAEDMQRFPSGLRWESGELLPFELASDDRTEMAARFAVDADRVFSVELQDEYGFHNHGAADFTIRAVPDGPPNVNWSEPAGNVEVVPTAVLGLAARIEDDFGIRRVALIVESLSADARPSEIDLTEYTRTMTQPDGVLGSMRFNWSLAEYGVVAGQTLRCELAAWDNDPASSDVNVGHSPPLYVRIIATAEFESRVREEIVQVEEAVRQVANELRNDESDTESLAGRTSEGDLADSDRESARSLSRGAVRLGRRLREIARRVSSLHQRMEANQAGEPAMRKALSDVGRSLEQVESGSIALSAQALAQAAQESKAEQQTQELVRAVDAQRHAGQQLGQILRQLGEWGDFQSLVSNTRGLIDRQDRIRRETNALGEETLGKRREELEESQRQSLDRLAREQDSIGEDLARLLKRMKEVGESVSGSDPGAGAAIEDADRAARSEGLQDRIRRAKNALQENRTASAAMEQKSAADVLRRMADALESRRQRELEFLRKEARRAEEELRVIIEQQRDLRAATHEAGVMAAGDEVVNELAEDQARLRRNTDQLSTDFAAVRVLMSIAERVKDAVAPMSDAEARLEDRRIEEAPPAQDAAVTVLEEALAMTEEAAREAEQALLQKYLNEIKDDLQEIAAAQDAVHQKATALVETVREAEVVTRREARDAARLAREEAGVEELIASVLPDLEKVAVYHWAMERVSDWVGDCRQRLESRRLDDELLETSDRVLRELARLLAAIDQTQQMNTEEKFAEAEASGGGGQGGAAGSGKPIPTVAELLVLRAMQEDVNKRTRELEEKLTDREPTERLLRQVRALGEDQAQVRSLTERLTGKAGQP